MSCTRHRSPHRDIRGVGIQVGDSVCYGGSSRGYSLDTGTVVGLTPQRVRVKWERGGTTVRPDFLCVVEFPTDVNPHDDEGDQA